MSKARITYRFDHKTPNKDVRKGTEPMGGEGQVIPLYPDEYRAETYVEERRRPKFRQLDDMTWEQIEEGDWAEHADANRLKPSGRQASRDVEPPREAARYTADYGVWNSPFDAETMRIEKLIREADEAKGSPFPPEQPRRADSGYADTRRADTGYADMRHVDTGYADTPRVDTGYADTRELPVDPEPAERPRHPAARQQKIEPLWEEQDHSGMKEPVLFEQPEPLFERPDSRHSPWYGEPVVQTVRRTRNRSWLAVFFTVVGAIATGTALGYFALTLFNGSHNSIQSRVDDLLQSAVPADAGSSAKAKQTDRAGKSSDLQSLTGDGTSTGTDGSASGAADASAGKTGTASLPVSLAEQTYYVLQNGVFSTKESADTARQALKERGLDGVTEPGDRYSVFVGAFGSKETAKLLSGHLEETKDEFYVKPYVIPGADRLRWAGSDADTVKSWFEAGSELVSSASELTTAHLLEAKPSLLDADAISAFHSKKEQWAEWKNAASGLPVQAKALAVTMSGAIQSAADLLDQYQSVPSTELLWQAQASLVQYLIAEKALLESQSSI